MGKIMRCRRGLECDGAERAVNVDKCVVGERQRASVQKNDGHARPY